MSTFSTILGYIQAAIPQLNSNSVAANYGKEAEAIGQAIDNTLAELANTQNIITGIIAAQNYAHVGYYVNAAKAYQEGDDLSIDANGNYYYAIIDTTKKIINQAAFEVVNNGTTASLTLKVATFDTGTGLLIALTSGQLSAFISYFLNFEIPGLPVSIISSNANSLAFNAAINYDPSYDLTTLQSNVNDALVTFRDTFPFNGHFYNYYLESYLVANATGVKAVYLSSTTIADYGGSPVAFSGDTSLDAGYFDYGTVNLSFNTI
jgi:hypothetical protein